MYRVFVFSLLLLALLAAAAEPSPASSRQAMSFEAPRELLDDATRDRALEEISAFGVSRLRALVYWRDYAPSPDARVRPGFDATDPAEYRNWGPLDRLFEAAAKRDISIQLTLTGPVPRWATESRRDNLTKPRPSEFEAFATAVGRRYGERVSLWSIWNEPNHPRFLLPQFERGRTVSPRLYRRLFQAGERGLRAAEGNASDTILMGETAPIGNSRIVSPLAFLRGALCLDAAWRKSPRCGPLPTAGYAHHPYTKRAGPRYTPPDRDDVTIGAVSRLVRALDRATRAGALPRGQGVYLTEFGIQSEPDPFVGVSLARQAEYLAIAEQIAFANPRVQSFSQYLLTDDTPRRGPRAARYAGFETGLKDHMGRPKPAYHAFRLPLAAKAYGRSDVLWGRVRPHPHSTAVTILHTSGGRWRELKTLQTNASGVYGLKTRHRSGQRYRVRWTAPGGTAYLGPPVRAH